MDRNYFSIFEHRKRNKLLLEMLSECTMIKIERFDGLPMYMCHVCVEKLCSAWDFKSMTIASDLKLRIRRGCSSLLGKIQSVGNTPSAEMPSIKEEISIKCEEIRPSISGSASDKPNGDVQEEIDTEPEECVKCNIGISEEPNNLVNEEDVGDLTKCTVENINDSIECNVEDTDDSAECNVEDPMLDSDGDDDDMEYDKAVAILVGDKQYGENKNTEDLDSSLDNKLHPKKCTAENIDDSIGCNAADPGLKNDVNEDIPLAVLVGEKPHKCDVCDKAFVLPFQLKVHQKVHAEEPEFSCEVCGKRFKQATAVYSHKFVHTDERPHKCDICGKGFKNLYSLNAHLRTHTKKTLFVCEVCGKAFRDHSTFSNHKVRHLNAGKTFPCSICGKSFASSIRMRDHEKKTHTDKKPHVCSYCGKPFKESQTLKIHTLVHTGEKPHSCNICGKQFRQLSCIPRHMRIHTGETPYPCELCPAKFKYSHHLKNHMKMHSG
ncbi:hypothetical protein Trydic_g14212 [Trypoxylus dichotomus]